MIESLIIALREGIEIALVVGILVVYLDKLHREFLVRSVYLGLTAAIFASVAGAIIIQRLALDHEMLEGYFMLIAAVFVATMLIWMWLAAKRIRRGIESRVDGILEARTAWRMRAGIFAFTFLMVVREGIETAIFLQAVALSTGSWFGIIGTLTGFGIAVAFAILFIRGSLQIDIARFLKVTAVALLIFVIQLIVNAFHEFYEYGVLPPSPQMMGILGPIVRNNTLFVLAIISIPAFMLIIPPSRSNDGTILVHQRRLQFSTGMVALSIAFFLGVGNVFSSSHEMNLSSIPIAIPEDGVIRIPVQAVGDGNLHRYSINDSSIEIRFFVLRTGLGKFATAFDACYACYNYGRYYMRGGELVCSQCDAPSSLMRMKPSLTEELRDPDMSGSMEGNGCSPIYLASLLKNGEIRITLADLQQRRKYFEPSAD